MKALILALALLAVDDPELEKRVRAFSRYIRCLVCQNETLADSRAELAVDLRRQIREQMKAGKNDEEITAFLTERYGDFVLYRPPLKPSTYLLWFGPFLLLGGGLFTLYRCLKRRPALIEDRPLSDAERKRARTLLEGDGMESNLTVYRDQLEEIKSDLAKGILGKEQFELEREDLERRLLADVPLAREGGIATKRHKMHRKPL
jgi:cytochrome c-type biogenesis protein CcmH